MISRGDLGYYASAYGDCRRFALDTPRSVFDASQDVSQPESHLLTRVFRLCASALKSRVLFFLRPHPGDLIGFGES